MSTALLYAVGVVVFLVAIFVSIALHELGHLCFAKRFGCRVSQYMVGFGPTLFSWSKNGTEYGIKAVPLGGFVKIIGMFPPATIDQEAISRGELGPRQVTLRKSNTGLFAQMVSETRSSEFEAVESGDEDRLFYKLSAPKKMLVMAAGPAVNIAIAFICFLGVYGLHGIHSIEPTGSTVVATVGNCVIVESPDRSTCQPGDEPTPAKKAGLRPSDEIVTINGQAVTEWPQVENLIHANGDRSFQMTVMRQGQRVELEPTTTVSLERDLSVDSSGDLEQVGYLGVTPESEEVVTYGGPIYTAGRMLDMTGHALNTVVEMPSRVWNVAMAITGQVERDQNGPMSVIGGSRIAGEVASSTTEGLGAGSKVALLGSVVGSFNLFIGIFNLIPFIPLDGGHIVGAGWEGLRKLFARLRRRPDPGYVDVAKQLPLAYGLGIALLSMGAVLMLGDVIVPISSGL